MRITPRLALVTVLACVTTGSAAATDAGPAPARAEAVAPATVERVHRYYATGPGAEYESDNGGITGVPPLVVRVPAGGRWDAVVEVSFQYRTEGEGPFSTDLGVARSGHRSGPDARPARFALAPAPTPTAATVRYLVPDLASGRRYEVGPGVNSVFADLNRILTRKVLVTVELTRR